MEITWNFICRPLTEETYWHTWGWRVFFGRSGKNSRWGLRNEPIMRRSHDLVGRIIEQNAIFSFFFFVPPGLFLYYPLFWQQCVGPPARVARLSVQRVVLKLAFWEIEKILWNRCNSVIWRFPQWWLFGDYYLLFASGLTRSPLKNDTFAA